MPFSISEQDTTESLEKPSEPSHVLASGNALSSPDWLHTLSGFEELHCNNYSNDYIKTFLNYGYRSMFWTEMSDMSSYQIIKEENDAWNTGGPEGSLFPK